MAINRFVLDGAAVRRWRAEYRVSRYRLAQEMGVAATRVRGIERAQRVTARVVELYVNGLLQVMTERQQRAQEEANLLKELAAESWLAATRPPKVRAAFAQEVQGEAELLVRRAKAIEGRKARLQRHPFSGFDTEGAGRRDWTLELLEAERPAPPPEMIPSETAEGWRVRMRRRVHRDIVRLARYGLAWQKLGRHGNSGDRPDQKSYGEQLADRLHAEREKAERAAKRKDDDPGEAGPEDPAHAKIREQVQKGIARELQRRDSAEAPGRERATGEMGKPTLAAPGLKRLARECARCGGEGYDVCPFDGHCHHCGKVGLHLCPADPVCRRCGASGYHLCRPR